MQALLREYPNGVSFDPMAIRLVRQRVPLEDSQIESLKADMFQMGDGLWFSREMISEDDSLLALGEQAEAWLIAHGFFSIEMLFTRFNGVLRHVDTPENLAAFLQYQEFAVATWGRSSAFCILPPRSLDEYLAETSKTVDEHLKESDGTLALHELEEAMPHLTTEALNGIRMTFLPEVHEAEIGGLPCWRSSEAIPLPEDFTEQLTTAVDTLVALGEKVSAAKLQFALNLVYRIHFREEYALQDNRAFMRVCAKYYQGPGDVFPKMTPPRTVESKLSAPGKRVRRPNTRFGHLSIPIGAELVFTKDGHTTCTILDNSNQVEYEGKPFAISRLAMHLLDVSVANGFQHFSYKGETLWERRTRLEREGKASDNQAVEVPPARGHKVERDIIGLKGSSLSPATWRSYRADGTNPRVAEWAKRIDAGDSVEQIAVETEYAVSTVNLMICNYRLYLQVCKLNGIMPEDATNV